MNSSFLLASGSPRRAEILGTLGLSFRVAAPEVDERVKEGEAVDAYLARVVESKLDAAVRMAPSGITHVLVADTAVVLDGDILGKPVSPEHAARMLESLSARTHRVATRFALAEIVGDVGSYAIARVVADTIVTVVTFRAMSARQIAGYVATEEPLDKAGAYAIQGVAAAFVRRIEGSYSNVVGLPACEVAEALETLGILGA